MSDSFGNFILADAGNHRLQLFDKSRKFVGLVHIKQGKIFGALILSRYLLDNFKHKSAAFLLFCLVIYFKEESVLRNCP